MSYLILQKGMTITREEGMTFIHCDTCIAAYTRPVTQSDVNFIYDYDCASKGYLMA